MTAYSALDAMKTSAADGDEIEGAVVSALGFLAVGCIRSVVAHLAMPCRLRRHGGFEGPLRGEGGIVELLGGDAGSLVVAHVGGPIRGWGRGGQAEAAEGRTSWRERASRRGAGSGGIEV